MGATGVSPVLTVMRWRHASGTPSRFDATPECIDVFYRQNTVTGAKKIRKTNVATENFTGGPLLDSHFSRQY
jgi:hypothetical protein